MKPIIPSINYHITKFCNMKCKFCYATFNDLGNLKHNLEKSKKIIKEVANAKFTKITFAGGEPTLISQLPEMVRYAKELGLITTIVTNGYKLSEEKLLKDLAPYLDWVALSIDTLEEQLNLESGRTVAGNVLSEDYFIGLIAKLKILKIRV